MTRRALSRTVFTAIACAAAAAGCGGRSAPEPLPPPRASQRAEAPHVMVAAAHPLAADAGARVLRDGGNAVDAAVATAFVLGVVEPMMAGLGGGGGMTIWLQRSRRVDYLDFYPAAGANPAWGESWGRDSAPPERAVAVPGTVAGLLLAHEKYGALPRERVIEPAIAVARDGFEVHPLLASIIADNVAKLARDSAAAALLLPGGKPLAAGARLVQPALAATLRRIADAGRDGFHRGAVAEAIVRRLSGRSAMTTEDLASYEPRWRRPLCGRWGRFTLLSAAPPLDGTEVLETLALLQAGGLDTLGQPATNGRALAAMVDAVRAARMDRTTYVGMPDDAAVPAVGLTSAAYSAERLAAIAQRPPARMTAGDPWDEERSEPAAGCEAHQPYRPTSHPRPAARAANGEPELQQHTTHLSVVDSARNAVSLTFTVGQSFGSGVMAAGTFLNSAVQNFGGPAANRRAPGRTPRSTIAPTIVLEGDSVRLVVGSPGSAYIPPAIVHSIVYTLGFGLDPAVAIAMPRVFPSLTEASVQVEDGFSDAAIRGLERRGYKVVKRPLHHIDFGGVHMVLVTPRGLVGAADPRRAGAAVGW